MDIFPPCNKYRIERFQVMPWFPSYVDDMTLRWRKLQYYIKNLESIPGHRQTPYWICNWGLLIIKC